MNKYLVVRDTDGLVTNAIVLDEGADYAVENHSVFPLTSVPTGVWIGWKMTSDGWVPPTESEHE